MRRQSYCAVLKLKRRSFKVYKGDITAHRCDVIVNAANEDLQHIGGVAKSILVLEERRFRKSVTIT